MFTGLLVACGLAMFAILYLVMRYVPTYAFRATAFTPNEATMRGGLSSSPAPSTRAQVLHRQRT